MKNPYQKSPRTKVKSFTAYGGDWRDGETLPDGSQIFFEFSGDGFIECYKRMANPLMAGGAAYSLSYRFIKIDDATNIVEEVEFTLDQTCKTA